MKTLSLSTLTLKILLTAALSLGSFFSVSQTMNKPDNVVEYLAKGYSPVKWVDTFIMDNRYSIILDTRADGRYLVSGTDGNEYEIYNKAGEKIYHYKYPDFFKATKAKLYLDNSVVVVHAKDRQVHIVHFMPDGIIRTFKVEVPIRESDDHRFSFSDDRRQIFIPTKTKILIVDIFQQKVIQRISHNVKPYIRSLVRNDDDGFFKVSTPEVEALFLTPEGRFNPVELTHLGKTKIYRYGTFIGFHKIIMTIYKKSPSIAEFTLYDYVNNDIERFQIPVSDAFDFTKKKHRQLMSSIAYGSKFIYLVTPSTINVVSLATKKIIAKKTLPDLGKFKIPPSAKYYPANNVLRIRNRHTDQTVDFVMPEK